MCSHMNVCFFDISVDCDDVTYILDWLSLIMPAVNDVVANICWVPPAYVLLSLV